MTEPKVGNTRVPLETGDPATPGLGWAPGDSVDASAAEEGVGWAWLGWAGLGCAGLGWAGLGWVGLGWAGLGTLCR